MRALNFFTILDQLFYFQWPDKINTLSSEK